MKNPFTNAKGKLIPDGKNGLSFVEDCLAFVLVLALTFLAIFFRIMDKYFNGVISTDVQKALLEQIGLVFACVAGVITWRENKHLSLGSIVEKIPQSIKKVFNAISSLVVPMILVQFFFTTFSQMFNSTQDWFTKSIGVIPYNIFFVFLPICYLAMVIMVVSNKENRVLAIIGVCLGFLTSVISIGDLLSFAFKISPDGSALYKTLEGIWPSICANATWIIIVLMLLMAFMGVPLFLVITGILYVLYSAAPGGIVSGVVSDLYLKFTKTDVLAIPLFTIAGYLLSRGSASKRFVNLFNALFGWFRGGAVIASVLVITFFTTFTGVSGVTILALGSLLSIILVGTGYDKDKAEGLITSSGALGLLFPPSIAIIMFISINYQMITTELGFSKFDITDPFVGALIPGVIMTLAMIVLGIIFDKNKNRPKLSGKAIAVSLKDSIFELLLPVIICVTLFSGFDIFEVASIAVLYTILLTTVIRKDFSLRGVAREIADSVPVSGGVLFIIAAASCLSVYMALSGIPENVTEFITQYVPNKYVFLLLMNIVLLITGCLLDIYSATILIAPILIYAAEMQFDIPVVQTSVIFLMNLSIGFLTPPVGMDLFISSYAFNKPVSKVIRGVLPFLGVQLVVLMLVTYIPSLTTCLIPADHFEKTEWAQEQKDMLKEYRMQKKLGNSVELELDDGIPDFDDNSGSTGETVIIDGVEYQL